MSTTTRVTFVLLGACMLLLQACGATQPSAFYVLSALPNSDVQTASSGMGEGPVIGVGPVEVARYLDRPQIVSRSSPNKLQLDEFHKWAEPLPDNITRVVAENLSILLGSDNILVYPWGSAEVQQQVEIRVMRFDRDADGTIKLVTLWTIFGPAGREVMAAGKSRLSEPVSGESYEAMAVAMSENLAALSREIVSAIKGVSRKESALQKRAIPPEQG